MICSEWIVHHLFFGNNKHYKIQKDKINKKEVNNTVTVLFKAQNKDELSVCSPLVYTRLWIVLSVCVYSIF